MARLPKEISDFMAKYSIDAAEIWQVPGGKSYAVKHSALERVAAEAGIWFDPPKVIEANSAEKIAVVCVTGHDADERTEWSFGESAPHNCKNAYTFSMAEKRGKDRVILKLLSAHGAVYSSSEIGGGDDEEPKRENPHRTPPEDIYDGKPNGEIPRVPGVTALPKAKSIETYKELEAEMRRLETLPGLMAWGKTIAATVATMHEEFQETFRRAFANYRDELRAMAEAAE